MLKPRTPPFPTGEKRRHGPPPPEQEPLSYPHHGPVLGVHLRLPHCVFLEVGQNHRPVPGQYSQIPGKIALQKLEQLGVGLSPDRICGGRERKSHPRVVL